MNELSITRFIDAPPATVWDIMVNRQEEWWCPTPWRAEIDRQDRRPGGACDMTFYGPDGEEMPQHGIYLEWIEGVRFTSTDAVRIDPGKVTGQPADAQPGDDQCATRTQQSRRPRRGPKDIGYQSIEKPVTVFTPERHVFSLRISQYSR